MAVSDIQGRRLPLLHRTTGSPPEPEATVGSGALLTLAAWLLSRVVVGAGWGAARNPFTFTPSLWTRWDSFQYLAIAAHGRTFGRCGSPGLPPTPASRLLHQTLCGTAPWLPGYPWLVRALYATGLSLPDAGLLISWSAMATAIFLVWFGWGRDLSPGRALLLLLLFGVFPGSVYNFAVFPTSVALACVVGAIVAATRERFLVAALLMTAAGLCYPTGWFAAAGLAVGLVLIALPLGTAAIVRRALWGLAGFGSLLVLGLHDEFAFGYANAFFLEDTQRGVGSVVSPGQAFLRLVIQQNSFVQTLIGRFSARVLAFQAVLAVALTGAAVAVTAVAWRRQVRVASQVYPALVGTAVVLALVAATSGGAWNRSVVLAAPCVVCLRRAPLPVLCGVVAVAAVTTALMSRAFFVGTLP